MHPHLAGFFLQTGASLPPSATRAVAYSALTKVDMVAYSRRLIGRRHEADRRCMDSYLERAVVVCSKRCPGGYTMTSITEISECPHERWLATSIRRPARLNSSFRRGSSGFTVSYTRQVYGHWP